MPTARERRIQIAIRDRYRKDSERERKSVPPHTLLSEPLFCHIFHAHTMKQIGPLKVIYEIE